MTDEPDNFPVENLYEDIGQLPLKLQNEAVLARSSIAGQFSLEPITKDITADITCEFLEVAFQQILYCRGIYPKDIFACRKKYSVPVQMCMYPDLSNYIVDVIKPIKPLLLQDSVKAVELAIRCKDKAIEKFVFELNPRRPATWPNNDPKLVEIELSLRELLLKILSYNAPSLKNKKLCTFEILVHVQGSELVNLLFNETSEITWIRSDVEVCENKTLIPIGTIKNSPFLEMQVFALQQT